MHKTAFCLILLFSFCSCSDCTCNCGDCSTPNNETQYFCGNDNETHLIPSATWFFSPECYFKCGITLKYPGTCECPNNCFNLLNRGYCSENSCICSEGWKGPDCSLIDCSSGNNCSGNGKCMIDGDTGDNYCMCNDGFTSIDCSVVVTFISPVPYENFFPNDRNYWAHDKYGDFHPLFNLSVITILKISISEENLSYIYNTSNLFNESYVEANLIFDNGHIRKSIDAIGIRIKGTDTRLSYRRGLDFKLPKKLYGIHKLQTKGSDSTYLHNLLATDIYRSMNIPSPRSCFASLYINEVHIGLYWMSEAFDKSFIDSRFQNSSGNFYKGSQIVQYLGDNQGSYQNLTWEFWGFKIYVFEQIAGNGNWSDFINLAKYGNLTNRRIDEISTPNSSSVFDDERFVRVLAADILTTNVDSYETTGNNWFVFHNYNTGKFELFAHDFDLSWDLQSANMSLYIFAKVRAIEYPYYMNLLQKYVSFLAQNVLFQNTITMRINQLKELLQNEVKVDGTFQLSFHLFTPSEAIEYFNASYEQLYQFIQERYLYISNHM